MFENVDETTRSYVRPKDRKGSSIRNETISRNLYTSREEDRDHCLSKTDHIYDMDHIYDIV